MGILREKRYLGLIGNILTLVGAFLPFVSVSVSFLGISAGGISVSLFSGAPFWGILVILASIFSLLVIFSDMLVGKAPIFAALQNQKMTFIATIVSAVSVIINIISVPGGSSYGTISWGIGFWIIIIGLVASAAYPFLYKGQN